MGEGGVPVVGGFSDLVEVGRGGFSRVFSAYQVEFDRRVALKVLNDRLADDASVAVFESECRAMGTLSQHPFIVTVLASALTADYRPCIVMELFERGNYMQLLRRDGPLPLEELLSLSVRVAGALATAHHHGVVHGDVKPQNVLKSEFGYPALGDFGIATLRNRLSERAGTSLSAHYAAPELIESGATAAGAAADQYSLAATIFTLACGRRPFEGATAGEAPERVLARVLAAPTPRLAASFPQDLADTLARAMSRDPHHRFPDLAALAFALTAVEHQLGYRATAVPLASIDDDATITINHPNPPTPPQQPPPPSQPSPASQPPGDEHTIAIAPQPPEPPAPPQQPNRRRRITALLALLLVIAGAAAYLTLGSGTPEPDTTTQASATNTEPTPDPEPDNQPAPTDTTTQASATDTESTPDPEPDNQPAPTDTTTQASATDTESTPDPELDNQPAPTDTTTQASATDTESTPDPEPDNQPAPAVAAATDIGSEMAAMEDSSDAIRIPLHNWSSQLVGAEVVGGILEEAGFSVEYVPSDSQFVYQSMCDGDIELVHEVWEDPFGVAFQQQVDKGCVLDWSTHNAVTREGWWYPIYVEQQCPGLPDWEALNACASIFATAETGDKGRFLTGPANWFKGDAERVEGLGMDFEVINAGSAATLWAELDPASADETPIVLFNWTPNFVEAVYEGRFVEFPTFEDACLTDPSWGFNAESTHDCGNPDGYLKTGVGQHFPEKWPTAAAIVQRMDFTNQMLAAMAAAVDVDGKRRSEAATEWLAANETLWQGWISG